MYNPIINDQLKDINSKAISEMLEKHANYDVENHFWDKTICSSNDKLESGTISTAWSPCENYPENTDKQICKTCKFCQHIQSKPQQCKCSKHKNWELFDINNYLCGFYKHKNCSYKHKNCSYKHKK